MRASDAQLPSKAHGVKELALLAVLVVLGLMGAIATASWMERSPRRTDIVPAEERLYVSGPAAKRMSLAFGGIIADWYWMRSLQYVGRKALTRERIRIDNLSELDLKLLAPLLDTAATLDPKFMAVYEYGAVVLPTVSDRDADEDAVALLKKGINANPDSWRLYQHLGYIYWQRGDYMAAAEAYAAGSRLSGAPSWMKTMEINMRAHGSSPQLAREIYERMRAEAKDDQVRSFAEYRLAKLASDEERAVIDRLLRDYAARAGGRCPAAWREVAPSLRAAGLSMDRTGAPLDPTGLPYVFKDAGCSIDLHPDSKIPRK